MMRTSLARAPSSFTPEQQIARQEAYESDLWHRFGAVVIRIDDLSWPWELRTAAEAKGIQRFGKRRGKAA